MPHFYPKHLPDFPYVGRLSYALEFTTEQRARLLNHRSAIDLVAAQFLRAAREKGFVIVVYCLMPDHVHLLVEGLTAESDLRRFVGIGKQRAAYLYSRATGGKRLWQEGFHEYVIENPVRAGLVSSPFDYKPCGSELWPIADILSG
jgi:REP element-mobilizing transposase RayT